METATRAPGDTGASPTRIFHVVRHHHRRHRPPVQLARRHGHPRSGRESGGYRVNVITKIPELTAQYVDRATDREVIERLLRNRQRARVAIYGLPGMGKTALAAKLARSVQANLQLDKVLW